MQRTPNKVSIYACGGAGINIVGSMPPTGNAGCAVAMAYAIDTSRSNLDDSPFSSENVFLFEGVDGSGQERSENHVDIAKNAQAILQKFKPGVFNVLVHSGGGGSGSVIAGSLVNEMLQRGEQLIIVLIGGTATLKQITNTEKTFKSYDNLARNVHRQPIVVCYLENGPQHPEAAVNATAHASLQALLMLFSGMNNAMDTADLRNWVKNTGSNEVFALHFVTSEAYEKVGDVISVATLAQKGQDVALLPRPAYQATGFVTSEESKAAVSQPLHCTLSGNLIDRAAKSLREAREEDTRRLAAITRREALVDSNDKTANNGLIL